MPIIKPTDLELTDQPEVVIGLVAAVGTPLHHVQTVITGEMEARGYDVDIIHMSSLIGAVEEEQQDDGNYDSEYERIKDLMARGTALRARTESGDVLALLAAARISDQRPRGEAFPVIERRCFLLRQLKHPDEAKALRLIYGHACHIVGVYSPEYSRQRNLIVNHGMTPTQARDLIETDQGEDHKLGQQLRDTFHLADVFIPLSDPNEADLAESELSRYVSLMFGDIREGIPTPRPDEVGMYLAWCASLRSADLSRQVGAAILSKDCDVIAVGCNEVPAANGGQYWCDGPVDGRDVARGRDSNAEMKWKILEEILEVVDEGFGALDAEAKEEKLQRLSKKLGPTRVMNLTEFGRAVHAEMEALLAAARLGVSVRGAVLYTTTFPCHNCAKHIVDAGIKRVLYVEPYPKSLAMELHNDSIRLDDEHEDEGDGDEGRIDLKNFVGVAPRRFASLFSMRSSDGTKHRRKDEKGERLRIVGGLRTRAPAFNYMQREAFAAAALKEFISNEQQGELDLG